ncbi:NUDIX domain-containing protein [Gracilimonas sp.]|uniref:NUDIX domain-containing protein n=1 Tax=Gracilimonas sp. TaxID=1974203 RepID=UPI002870DD9A|nr:NUDIX domain-containing protein [Gracilimonas sp.]
MDNYSGRLRVRSCGVLIEEGKILLVELKSPVTKKWTWLPPGGAVKFGETIEEALIREFREETGLDISVLKRLKVNEVIKTPIHAIEFYHLVKRVGGELTLGSDPELSKEKQIIRDIGFFTHKELEKIRTAPDFLIKEMKAFL